ncbi:phosphomethylpyrimidine synthase 2 [Candidatus Scalindua japonica]|uniref:Phosphomethylpyrimidine synthase 2 n=2 Tax=Candidatus Scalindua japonica TaxID=1284222 RepID=A0A286TXV8_9BACT|nr:phosphomethylpyrimidine synthase 2 [Candidatus Scalindua japonica]
MGIARRDLDWKTQFETAITSEKTEEIRKNRPPIEDETCTMCSSVFSLKGVMEYYEDDLKDSRKKNYSAALQI